MSNKNPLHVREAGGSGREGIILQCKCGNGFDLVFVGMEKEKAHQIGMYAARVQGWFVVKRNDIAVCPTCRRRESKTEQTGGSRNE